jgi:hypothetical protein
VCVSVDPAGVHVACSEADALWVEVTFQGTRHLLKGAACPTAVLLTEPRGQPTLYIRPHAEAASAAVVAAVEDPTSALVLPGVEVFDVALALMPGVYASGDEGGVDPARLSHINMVLASPVATLRRFGFHTDSLVGPSPAPLSTQENFPGGGSSGDPGGGKGGAVSAPPAPAPAPAPVVHRVPVFDGRGSDPHSLLQRTVKAGVAAAGVFNVAAPGPADPDDDAGGCCSSAGFALTLRPYDGSAGAWRPSETGFPLLVAPGAVTNPGVLAAAEVLAAVARPLCARVFKIPPRALTLFVDVDNNTVAFNSGGKVALNVRYLAQAQLLLPFGAAGRPGKRAGAARCGPEALLSFWFMTLAHELAHNGCSAHNADFANHMETIAAASMPAMAELLADAEVAVVVAAAIAAAVAAAGVA